MKINSLIKVVIFSGVIFHSALSFSQEVGLTIGVGEDGPLVPNIPGPHFPGYPGLPKNPKIPKFDFERIELLKKKEFLPEKHITYSVTFKSQNEKPPSCDVIKHRLKNFETRFSELNFYTKKIAKGEFLSHSEVASLAAVSRKYLPDVIDDIDRFIQVQIQWDFFYVDGLGRHNLYTSNKEFSIFNDYSFKAPGVEWSGNTEMQPPFVQLETSPEVKVTFRMSTLDFCFSDQRAVLNGVQKKTVFDNLYEIQASWKADLYNQPQLGITEPVITNKDIE